VISPGGRQTLGRVHTIAWSEAEPVRVRGPEDDILTLDLSIQYEIVHLPHDKDRGPYKVSTRGYMHALQTIDGAEVIAFHWHPNGKGDGDTVRAPHTHIGSTQLNPAGVISKKHHIPGRRMSVEEVLRYCITEIGVMPLRNDWEPVLADSEDLFRMWASWGADRTPDA